MDRRAAREGAAPPQPADARGLALALPSMEPALPSLFGAGAFPTLLGGGLFPGGTAASAVSFSSSGGGEATFTSSVYCYQSSGGNTVEYSASTAGAQRQARGRPSVGPGGAAAAAAPKF